MVTIQHPGLKKQFEQFSKLGSDEEKQAFWEAFNRGFEAMNETEQAVMRQAWEVNVTKMNTV